MGSDPAVTVSVALAAGLFATALARHLRLPAIVLLLAAGALLGPDALGLVRPHALGGALHTLVGFAVAVVLFEGGLNLNVRRLRRESATIQRLVTLGVLVTASGAAIAARAIMHWPWRPAFLFGSLVIVTGPTVINPLLRRIRIKKSLQTILEGEGVLIDPIGAMIAVAVLDVALHPSLPSLATGVLATLMRLGFGALLGFLGGGLIALALRRRRLVPEGLENIFALSIVLALFHVSNHLQPESGIASVTVAGVVVGNVRTRVLRDLMEFKEQLTVLLIGMLFVLLAADVRLADLHALGSRGLWTVAALMLVVRPLNILASTVHAGLGLREKIFLSSIAPRGIVAAAVASFFAGEMERAGVPGGVELRAMVFLVIAATVTVQGLAGGRLAALLGVRRRTNRGWAILGANELGRTLGKALRAEGEEVLFLDSNADASNSAEAEGFRVLFGNALEERLLQRAGVEALAGCLGVTVNEEVNLLFATKAREEFKVPRAYVVLLAREGHVTPAMVGAAGGGVLFGEAKDVRLWESCVRRGLAGMERWRFEGEEETARAGEGLMPAGLQDVLLPLTVRRGDRAFPLNEATRVRPRDEVTFLLFHEKRAQATAWLARTGWTPAPPARETDSEARATLPRQGTPTSARA